MKRAIIFLVLITPVFSLAQDSNLGNWLIYIGNKNLNNQWNLHHEVQYRNYDAIGDMEQLLLRTGLGYNLTENNNNILLGYGYIVSKNYMDGTDAKQTVKEHRIYQQFQTKQKLNRISLSHRFRIEQRFVEELDLKWRFRYFLSANVPLNKPDISKGAIYASAYNELFINGQGDAFDRNRIYGGFGYKFNNSIRLELGYMNQVFNKGSRDQINTILFVSF